MIWWLWLWLMWLWLLINEKLPKYQFILCIIIIIIMIRFVARTYPPCWVLKARIQKHRCKSLLFHDKCPGFFYVHYTTHGTYSFTSHPKDEAIMVKCLAQGHKRRDRPGRDSNPHSGNTRTWVQCTRPLGHNNPLGKGCLKEEFIVQCSSFDFFWFKMLWFDSFESDKCFYYNNYVPLRFYVC